MAAFDEAKRLGLRITAHAGEASGAESVREALDVLHAERIGHGYRVLEDEKVYERVLRDDVHMELCLTSSMQTGAQPSLAEHACRRFVTDGANVGLNTDDPSVCGTTMLKEFEVAVNECGLQRSALGVLTFNAARSCFLPDAEKAELLARLRKVWTGECECK